MNSDGAYILADIFSNIDVYMLIFIRFVGLLTIMPVFGGNGMPVMSKVGLSLILASIVYTSGMVADVYYTDTIIGYLYIILKEFLVGLIIGYVVYFMFNVTYFAGHLTDQQIGFSMANVFDPVTQTQVPISGNLYYFAFCALFVVSGGHRTIISTIFYSFRALPVGSEIIVGNDRLVYLIIELMGKFFVSGVMMALPVMGTILVIDVALGVLVKAVPRMNVFVVGMPLKVLVGLLAIWLIVPMFAQVFNNMFNVINEYILSIIRVMMQ